jgi:catechol 2,3-dioxygenase-like lactoylglutathione lyase family enzyme/predicted enzyme related to lactoylglutathione lyase
MTTFTLPNPKLGQVYSITISTSSQEASLQFYRQLGFSELFRSDFPVPLILISDGSLLIMLRSDDNPYIALTYYVKNMDELVAGLEEQGITFTEKKALGGGMQRNMITSPDGVKIGLVTYVDGFVQPTGNTMLNLAPADYFNPEKYPNPVCGLFGEFAHPVTDLNASIAFWEKLGFVTLSKYETPQPWAILSDGLAVVGLHQTTEFSYPVITYFAADMKERIEKLKNNGLEIHKDLGGSNVVLSTPDGQYFNLFNLGM